MKKTKLKERCGHDGCYRRAQVKHECRTCDELGKEIFTVAACGHHATGAMEEIKRHCLVKHPVNILRGVGAALKGEDVF